MHDDCAWCVASLTFVTVCCYCLQKTDCEAHPWVEIYTDTEIHFVGVLDHNDDFYVEEASKLGEERAKAERTAQQES